MPPFKIPAGRRLVFNRGGLVQAGTNGALIESGGMWHVLPAEIRPNGRWRAVTLEEAQALVTAGTVEFEDDADLPEAEVPKAEIVKPSIIALENLPENGGSTTVASTTPQTAPDSVPPAPWAPAPVTEITPPTSEAQDSLG